MNATHKNIEIAENYYQAMGSKNLAALQQYIHPEIEFIAPLARTNGKEDFLEAAKKFMALFKTLTIETTFGKEDKAVVVYHLDCSDFVANIRAVALLTFKEELIRSIELFYDPRPFVR